MTTSQRYLLKTVYGPHPDQCYGGVLYIDPLLPPKKCPLDCVFCPLGRTVIKTAAPHLYVGVDKITDDIIEYLSENGRTFENIVVWGFGDPLLNYQLPAIVSSIKNLVKAHGIEAKILVKTSGFNLTLSWIHPIYELVDEIILQLSVPASLWRLYTNPPQHLSFKELVNKLQHLDKRYKRKISAELVVFRVDNESNFEEAVILELTSVYKRVGVAKVYVTTIERPASHDVKPVQNKILERVAFKLSEEGILAQVCSRSPSSGSVRVNVSKWMYNHLLRIPLNTGEIIKIYGSTGLHTLEQMVKDNIVDTINWEKHVFFKAKYIPLLCGVHDDGGFNEED